jgi:hypothetical protein
VGNNLIKGVPFLRGGDNLIMRQQLNPYQLHPET